MARPPSDSGDVVSGLRIDVRGLDTIRASLKAAPSLIDGELKEAGRVAVLSAVAYLSSYPSPPPGSRYHRTHRLSQGWRQPPRYVAGGGGTRLVVRNTVPYAPYVQDQDTQAWMHRNRGWETVQSVQAKLDGITQRQGALAAARVAAKLMRGG